MTDDNGVHLEIMSGAPSYGRSDPVAIKAQVSYAGPGASTVIGTAGSGPVAFGVRELDAPVQLLPAIRADCRDMRLDSATLVIPFAKSGSVPDVPPGVHAFAVRYFADPELHLPIGTWEIFAEANYLPGGCESPTGEQRYTRASVVVTVTP